MELADAIDLLDWKRRVFALYADVRADGEPRAAWERWRTTRDEQFAGHPQTPLTAADRAAFSGLAYYPYDPALRVQGTLEPASPTVSELPSSGESAILFDRIGRVGFGLAGTPHVLEVYWLAAYAGGLFLPFRDATSGSETYGGGRYLFDTVKGADLGVGDGRLTLDFNFSYHPSCSYQPSWVCPLAPPANTLEIPLRAGERTRA
jgi:uncharacterized protein (DUF1684 family)